MIWNPSEFVRRKAETLTVEKVGPGAYVVSGHRVFTDATPHRMTWLQCDCRHARNNVGLATCSHATAVAMKIVDEVLR